MTAGCVKLFKMKLRTILFVLALLAFTAVSVSGYLYYSSLKKSAIEDTHRRNASNVATIKNHLSAVLTENMKAVRALAGLKEFQQALVSPDADTLAKANRMLDHFRDAYGLGVCYLMDADGNTVASSNRRESDSFIGKNYAFRPYSRQALQGVPAVYMGLGVTSKKEGVYFSHSVCTESSDHPIGVVAVKTSIDDMEKEIGDIYEGTWMLTDPHGVVFASNRKNWLHHLLWKIPATQIAEIAASRQFGNGPWRWTGLAMLDQNRAGEHSGDVYLFEKIKLDCYPGWNIFYLTSLKSISGSISHVLIESSGYLKLALCLLIGLSVFFFMPAQVRTSTRRKKWRIHLNGRMNTWLPFMKPLLD